MATELMYTSAKQGLRSGAHGYCTVAQTAGLAPNVVQRLENLSGYRFVFPPQDPLNPVNYSFTHFNLSGRDYHVLSRICSSGYDYTQRSNMFAHHVLLDDAERSARPGGPARLAPEPGFLESSWRGDVREIPDAKNLPREVPRPPRPARAWEAATGDAGWAGVLAEFTLANPNTVAGIIFKPGQDLLALFDEALALLPPEKRWKVPFSTYVTGVIAGAPCIWCGVLPDAPVLAEFRRNRQALLLDLSKGPVLGEAKSQWPLHDCDLAACARSGEDPWPAGLAGVVAVKQIAVVRTNPTPGAGLPAEPKSELRTAMPPPRPRNEFPGLEPRKIETGHPRRKPRGSTGVLWKTLTAIAVLLPIMAGAGWYLFKLGAASNERHSPNDPAITAAKEKIDDLEKSIAKKNDIDDPEKRDAELKKKAEDEARRAEEQKAQEGLAELKKMDAHITQSIGAPIPIAIRVSSDNSGDSMPTDIPLGLDLNSATLSAVESVKPGPKIKIQPIEGGSFAVIVKKSPLDDDMKIGTVKFGAKQVSFQYEPDSKEMNVLLAPVRAELKDLQIKKGSDSIAYLLFKELTREEKDKLRDVRNLARLNQLKESKSYSLALDLDNSRSGKFKNLAWTTPDQDFSGLLLATDEKDFEIIQFDAGVFSIKYKKKPVATLSLSNRQETLSWMGDGDAFKLLLKTPQNEKRFRIVEKTREIGYLTFKALDDDRRMKICLLTELEAAVKLKAEPARAESRVSILTESIKDAATQNKEKVMEEHKQKIRELRNEYVPAIVELDPEPGSSRPVKQ